MNLATNQRLDSIINGPEEEVEGDTNLDYEQREKKALDHMAVGLELRYLRHPFTIN
jgi:hypothetical protein